MIDLRAATAAVGSSVRAKFAPKPAAPPYVRYQEAPLVFDGTVLDIPTLDGFRVGFKIFDYGVISLRLTRAFVGTWGDLADASDLLVENEGLERQAEQACRTVAERLAHATTDPRHTALTEDYLVFAINDVSRPHTADEIVEHHGDVIASMLRGERAALSRQERDDIPRHRISYLATDLVIRTWNAAFVYDTPAGADGALEIVEFAIPSCSNSATTTICSTTRWPPSTRTCRRRRAGTTRSWDGTTPEPRGRCTRCSST